MLIALRKIAIGHLFTTGAVVSPGLTGYSLRNGFIKKLVGLRSAM